MSKKKKSSNRGWIAGLSIVGVLGILTAAIAYATKGFKKWGFIERILTGGETVMKLKMDGFNDNLIKFSNGSSTEEIALYAQVDLGSLSENGKTFYLGEAEEEANMAKSDFEALVEDLNLGESTVAKIEEEILNEDALCKVSLLSLPLTVEHDEDEAAFSASVVPWFDAIRVNYKLPGSRMILSSNVGATSAKTTYFKEANTSKMLREDIKIFNPAKNETSSENTIIFSSAALKGKADNTVIIDSIELIKTVRGHSNDYCWLTQSFN